MAQVRGAWLLVAACTACLPTLSARADELPPPVIRPSVRRPATSRAVRAAPRPSVSRSEALPYRLPYAPRRAPLPVSSPLRSPDRTAAVSVLAASNPPRRAAPTRPRLQPSGESTALPRPVVRAGLPVWGPPAAPASGRRLATTTSPRLRTSATAPRWRQVACRTVPRRAPVRRLDLTVPCAPGQAPPPEPTRCRLPLSRPYGCTEDG